MVIAPVLSLYLSNMMIGWGAAPYNPQWASQHPKRYALMSLAGPMTNVLLAVIAFVLLLVFAKSGALALSGAPSFTSIAVAFDQEPNTSMAALARVLSVMFSLNVLLAIFNLLPVPPLDGAAVLEGFWPKRVGGFMDKVREVPMYGLLGLLLVWQLVPYVLGPVWSVLVVLLHTLYL
jgi:Zn-dependent protease